MASLREKFLAARHNTIAQEDRRIIKALMQNLSVRIAERTALMQKVSDGDLGIQDALQGITATGNKKIEQIEISLDSKDMQQIDALKSTEEYKELLSACADPAIDVQVGFQRGGITPYKIVVVIDQPFSASPDADLLKSKVVRVLDPSTDLGTGGRRR